MFFATFMVNKDEYIADHVGVNLTAAVCSLSSMEIHRLCTTAAGGMECINVDLASFHKQLGSR